MYNNIFETKNINSVSQNFGFENDLTYVKKRNNQYQEIDFSKIQTRLKYLSLGYFSKEDRNYYFENNNSDTAFVFLQSKNQKCKNMNNIFDFKNTKLSQLTFININMVTQKVVKSIVNKISTNKIDEIAARICAELAHTHPEYDEMSSRIIISNHHKNTRSKSFLGITEYLYLSNLPNKDSLINKEYYKFIKEYSNKIEKIIDYSRDYKITYFGFKTLEKSYLLKHADDNNPVERPQDMWMRIAIALNIYYNDIDKNIDNIDDNIDNIDYNINNIDNIWNNIKTTYNYISLGYYTHASPTLFNAGTKNQQMLSCFLLGSNDSLEGIMKTATDIAKISKRAGGIGFHFNWRSSGSLIKGTNGKSSGPIPFLQIYDKILCAFNQGGKRKGSGAAYMSIDHPDIMEFIECRLPHKKIDNTTPDLFLAVSMRDLFMKRAIANENWSLFDPNECPGLFELYGIKYEKLYIKYEKEGKAKKVIKARVLSENLARCRLESGIPYIYHIDMANRKSNQKNIGTINSSNLCSEIIEYSDQNEYACCALASICLPKFVEISTDIVNDKKNNLENKKIIFNYKKLVDVVRIAFRNVNRVIDINSYPVIETKISNMRHRPIGLGVQGLGDLYNKFKISFSSDMAYDLNKKIFETIYYATLTESCDLARKEYLKYKKILNKKGFVRVIEDYKIKREFINEETNLFNEYVKPHIKIYTKDEGISTTCGSYCSYIGSPLSQGKFQFDLWDDELDELTNTYPDFKKWNNKTKLSGMWDWDSLRAKIKKFGVRNSLTVALMPTASTAHIMGNSEAFEPIVSNIYRRDVLAGQFICVNKFLIKELIDLEIWSPKLKDNIINNNGSIQYIDGIPYDMKNRYKTVWELSQKVIINQASDRGPFVDQSQSMNLFISKKNKTIAAVTSMTKYAWMKRLKTGCYYLRTQDINNPQKFSVIPNKAKLENYNINNNNNDSKNIYTITDKDVCISCSG